MSESNDEQTWEYLEEVVSRHEANGWTRTSTNYYVYGFVPAPKQFATTRVYHFEKDGRTSSITLSTK